MIFEKIRKSLNKANQGVCHLCGCDLYSEDTINIINQVEAEYNNGWIPCSERLPEEAFGCLVTVMDYNPMTGNEFENILPYHVGFDGETWNDSDGKIIPFDVIAWQPLPQPPKGE